MPKKRDPIARFQKAIERHFDGVELALENARGLLAAAVAAESESETAASFVASLGAEEIGKALLLERRAYALVNNAEFRIHSRLFADNPALADPSEHVRAVLPWGTFVGKRGTHKGGMCDHRAKLQALRDYYEASHPRVTEVTDDTLTLSHIDIFAGRTASDVREIIEQSVYVGWDDDGGTWKAPARCTPSVAAFATAMLEVVVRLTSALALERKTMAGRFEYLFGAVTQTTLQPNEVFVAP